MRLEKNSQHRHGDPQSLLDLNQFARTYFNNKKGLHSQIRIEHCNYATAFYCLQSKKITTKACGSKSIEERLRQKHVERHSTGKLAKQLNLGFSGSLRNKIISSWK